MEVLGTLLTVFTIIAHIYKFISERVEDNSSPSYATYELEQRVTLSNEEALESMQIENLMECYASKKILNFNFEKAFQKLECYNSNYVITHKIRKGQVIYIKVEYSIPFNSPNKDFITAFSINHIQSNDNVIIYGNKTSSYQEKNAFDLLSMDLMHALSS